MDLVADADDVARGVLDAREGRWPPPDESQLRAGGAVDLVSLRRSAPAAATRWRLRVREVMVDAYAQGAHVVGATPSGRSVLARPCEATS